MLARSVHAYELMSVVFTPTKLPLGSITEYVIHNMRSYSKGFLTPPLVGSLELLLELAGVYVGTGGWDTPDTIRYPLPHRLRPAHQALLYLQPMLRRRHQTTPHGSLTALPQCLI